MREDWIEVELGDILNVSSGSGLTSKKMSGSGYPVYGGNGVTGYHSEFLFDEKKLIIGRVGVRCGVTHITKSQSWVTDNALVVSFKHPFLDLQFMRLKLQFENLNKLSNSTAQPVISGAKIYAYSVCIPPLPIQRTIVSKIESLFSDLDNGIADLKKAQQQLKIYRQAVLKKAFEGELTKEWRETQINLPTAEELLEQIKQERQKHYEQQLEDWKQAVKTWEENGKEGKKPAKPNSIKEFNSPETELGINSPSNWVVLCLGNLTTGVEYGSGAKSLDEGEIPVIRMGNMQSGKLDWSDLKYTVDKNEISQYILKKGDVLFNRTNSPEHVGKTVEYKGERPAVFAGYLIRVNHIDSLLCSSYLNNFLNSHPAKVYGSHVKTDGVNQSNINGQKLSNYPIPLPALKEQQQIVREIESRLSVCDKVEQNISEALVKSEALRQSILKKAFEGKLLSKAEIEQCKQEADYEPASVLLEKIKKEKKK
ncbi:restriction endonuclease subunit S [Labilibaculum sp.]|uniref:restriction endonuclease subunit S n=1 Tax=Labilibaculum sp. TaxID=2060723 RepID=UPI002AA8F53F|nr:restriction endonuclease subunit S [Labilibaculum sp.]